ncbi:hypothetical protein CDL15_Pgr016881 [Punica granatum]|uniref:Tetraspanin-19-like n=1 Tax=Punica granatum TaxID=22663 RepID=A0A218WXQ9_PUNGR|nr:hypothetical protein CDL15_Pgr016881 [Punica granatum]
MSELQYVTVVSLLVLFETAISADILLNSDWEKDLPEDPTGRFTDFEDFVKSNFDIFKWIGLLIALTQGLSILLSMVLRSIGSYSDDSIEDDRFPAAKLPLLNPSPPPPHPYLVKGDPLFAPKKLSHSENYC